MLLKSKFCPYLEQITDCEGFTNFPSLVQCQSVTLEILSQVSISISTEQPITNHTLIFSLQTFLFSSNFVTQQFRVAKKRGLKQ